MSAVRPPFFKVVPEEVERYGPAAAIVLAHIRYRCESDGPGRSVIDGERWWRVSVADLAAEVGLSVQPVRTALKALAGTVVAKRFSSDDTTKAYRLALDGAECQPPDLPFVSSNKPQDGRPAVCYQQQGPLLAATNAPPIETLETKETHPTGVQRNPSESADTATASDSPDPGIEEPTTQGEQVQQPDPNQDGLPGMHLLPLPTNHAPEPVREKTIAPAANGSRGHRLPEDWLPPQEVIARQRESYPFLDLREIFVDFQQYWLSESGRHATKLDWSLTWQRWVRREAKDFRGPRRPAISTSDARFAQTQALKAKFSGGR